MHLYLNNTEHTGVAGLVWHWNFSKNSFSQIAKILKSLKTFHFLKKTHILKSLQILKSLKTFRFLKKLIFSNRCKFSNRSKHFVSWKNSFSQIAKSLKTFPFSKKLLFSNRCFSNRSFSNRWKFTKTEEILKVVAFQNCSNLSYFHVFFRIAPWILSIAAIVRLRLYWLGRCWFA